MAVHSWEKIVEQIEKESDPVKIAQLAKKLNDAMITEEKPKVQHRLGIASAPSVLQRSCLRSPICHKAQA